MYAFLVPSERCIVRGGGEGGEGAKIRPTYNALQYGAWWMLTDTVVVESNDSNEDVRACACACVRAGAGACRCVCVRVRVFGIH